MRWFDSDFDYVQELIDTWNSRRKKIRTAYIIIAAVLLIAGILTAVFPVSIFAVMQYFAAAAVIVIGIYHFVTFASMTYYFRDYIFASFRYTERTDRHHAVLHAGRPDSAGNHFPARLSADLQRSGETLSCLKAQVLPHPSYREYDVQRRAQHYPCSHISRCLPFVSALALNYILAAYLIIGIALLIEAAGMHKISL